jgi:hypothetical protein
MESKKINQLATEMTPTGSDLTIIGDPITGVSRKITLLQLSATIGTGADLQGVTDNGATTTNPIAIGGLTITGLATGVLKSDSGVITSVPFGAANGVATLGGDGKVPSNQLPSYVDDVVEVANFAALPAIGETGKIYITLDNNKVYRWTGSIYVEIAANNAVWGAITGTLSNQTDLQNALNAKQNTITLTTTGTSGASTLVGSTLNIPNYSTDLSGYVPYTGATANLDLGTFDLFTDIINLNQLKAIGSGGLNIYSNSGTHIALMGGGGGAGTTFYGGIIGTTASFASSGGSDTFAINHSSGSGIALNITKGGNGEGLYINKTSGSGNAATIIGTLNATTLVKSGGTSSQFLKADGSVDSNSYVTLDTTQTITASKTFSENLIVNGTGTNSAYTILQSAGTNKWRIGNNYASGVNTFDIFAYDNSSTPLSINSNGAMTLSANVTTTGAQFVQNGFYLTNANGGSLAGYTHMWARNEGINFGLRNGTGGASFIFQSATGYDYTFPAATGTLALTSNLSAYLPLTGGTLTGALSGTSATFSGNIIAGGSTDDTSGGLYSNIALNGSTYSRYSLLTGGTARARFQFDGTNTTLTTTSTGGKLQLATFGAAAMEFVTNDSLKMTITSGGNVGIGTSSPTNLASSYRSVCVNGSSAGFFETRVNDVSSGRFISDANATGFGDIRTGIPIYFYTQDTERMRITSGGNVGIGTSSPSSILDSQTNSGTGNILNSTDVIARFGNSNNNPGNHVSTAIQIFQGSGTLGSGYATGFLAADNNTAIAQQQNTLSLISPTSMSGGINLIAADTSATIKFYTGGFTNERMRITSNGNIGMPTTYGFTTSNAANLYIDSGGGLLYRSTSSLKYKTEVEDLNIDTTDLLSKMRPVWYRSLGDVDRKDWSWYGFIAEELAEIEPRLVHFGYGKDSYEEVETTDDEGNSKIETKLKDNAVKDESDGVQYERITVLLVAEMQKQNKLLQELEARIKQLENK